MIAPDAVLDLAAADLRLGRKAAASLKEDGVRPDWWPAGRTMTPSVKRRKYKHPEDFLLKGWEYFTQCAEREIRPTRAGLVLHMGFHSMITWERYAEEYAEFREAHGILMLMLHNVYEQMLGKGQAAGIIFALKNLPDGFDAQKGRTFPWQDKQSHELSGPGGTPLGRANAAQMSPDEAYMAMVKGTVVENVEKVGEELEGSPASAEASDDS